MSARGSGPAGRVEGPTRRLDVPGPSRPARRSLLGPTVVALVVAVPAAVVVFADALGVDHRTPFVQLIAFRPQIAAGLVVLSVVAGVLGRSRAVLPTAVALGLVGALGLAAVAPRAGDAAADTPDAPGRRTLTVLTLNTYLGRADPDAVADVVRARRPDLVALPEAGGDLRRRLTALLDEDAGGAGYRSSIADDAEDGSAMTVFVARGLGRPRVTVDRGGTFPAIVVDVAASGVPGGLRFVAVHPQSPRPGDTGAWGRDVADLARWCTDGRPTVVAGDMNATADHREFADATAGCTDAASSVGEGLPGTWPAGLPRLLGAQIDHVLLAGGPRAADVAFLDVTGTDHRAVLATVAAG